MNERFAQTPDPPYWAVMFTNQRTSRETPEYERMAETLARIAPDQPGYLGIESTRDAEGFGITLSFWASEEAIAAWKRVAAHQQAQRSGHDRWYEDFHLRIGRVERAYTKSTSRHEAL